MATTIYDPMIVTSVTSQGLEWGNGYKFIPASVVAGAETQSVTLNVSSVDVSSSGSYQPANAPSVIASGVFVGKHYSLRPAGEGVFEKWLTATPVVPAGWEFLGWLTHRGTVSAYNTLAWPSWVFIACDKSYSPAGSGDLWWNVSADGTLQAGLFDLSEGTYQGQTAYEWWIPVAYRVAYTITYDANGGSGAPGAATVYANESWTCSSTLPTRSGYTFLGWSESPTATSPTYVAGVTYSAISSNKTLYAVWSPDHNVLIYDANGGVVYPGYKTVAVGESYGTLPTARRTGYVFSGWYTAAVGGTQVSSTTTMGSSGTATIYAHWNASTTTHVVTFDAGDGVVSGSSTKEVTEGSAIGTLPSATRSGYSFDGWFRSTVGNEEVTASTVMGGSDMTVYAHWSRSQSSYQITFDPNGAGGSVPYSRIWVDIGRSYGRLPVPTRVGYNFSGWYTAASGGTRVYPSDVPASSGTLYAHWENGSSDLFSVAFS